MKYVPCYLSDEALCMRKDTVTRERILRDTVFSHEQRNKQNFPTPTRKTTDVLSQLRITVEL